MTASTAGTSPTAADRDLTACVDAFGNISVDISIGGGPWAATEMTGASATPAVVAQFLRQLADDIERAI